MTIVNSIFEKCKNILTERGNHRGSSEGERAMDTVVTLFNETTGHKLSEAEGWIFMQCLKRARSTNGRFNEDDYIDLINYQILELEHRLLNEDFSEITTPTAD